MIAMRTVTTQHPILDGWAYWSMPWSASSLCKTETHGWHFNNRL